MTRVVVSSTSEEFTRRVRLAMGADNVELLAVPAPRPSLRDRTDLAPAAVIDLVRVTVELTAGASPDVVVFGPGVPTDSALAVAAHLDERNATTGVVLANGIGAAELLQAMRAGIRDVLSPDAELKELREVLERAGAAAAVRRQSAAVARSGRTRGRVIPVVSPKGGCGKTTIATNLAVGLSRLAPHQTVIVDLDLQFGDVASALQLTPVKGVGEASHQPDLDAMGLKTFLTPHPTGLFALCAPLSPDAADGISGDDVGRLIQLLADEFRYVVVDTAPGLGEHTLAVLDQASDAVMVCAMDVPSMRGLRKELAILDDLSFDRLSRHVLINLADRLGGLTVKDVEAVIGTKADLVLARSKAVPLSTNRGVPLLQTGTRDATAKQLRALVGRFQPQLKQATGRAPRHRATAR